MINLRKKIGELIWGGDVQETLNDILVFLPKSGKVLDLGAGACMFTKLLYDRGYKMTPVDIKDNSFYKDINIRSEIYDGKHIKYKDNYFDACIMIAILHHTPDPDALVKEAVRVSKRLIIKEDVITNIFQRLYTYFIDSLINREWAGHPHTNKTDLGWQELFKKLGLKIVDIKYRKSYLFMLNPVYYLEKNI